MGNKHFILTGLTAYADMVVVDSFPASGHGELPPPGKRYRTLKSFLSTSRTVGGFFRLQPLLVSFKKSQYHRHGWCYEYGDNDAHYIGHSDCLYQVTFDTARVGTHQLIDAIHAARTVIDRPFVSELATIPIRVRDIPSSRQLLVSRLEKMYQSSLPPPPIRFDFQTLFNLRMGSGGDDDSWTWRLVPIFIGDATMMYAALFLKASYDQYMFVGDDDIEEAILSNDAPDFVHDAVRAEIAVHNAYKVIEGIWGGNLPDDTAKMERGLRNLGVNPDEKVGYVHHGIHPKQRISDKIVALRKARNEKAAHGRIHADRKSTYYEICDFQALAKSFLLLHLRHKYPDVGI